METSTHTLSVDGIGDIEVTVSERGEGHPILVMPLTSPSSATPSAAGSPPK